MRLEPGKRLNGPQHSAYIVGERRESSPWHQLYSARKLFFNYRPHEREYYEAGEDEWIDVLIKTGPDAEDAAGDELDARAQLLRYETEVLSSDLPWCAEPIDLFDVTADAPADGSRRRGRAEPALVLSVCHGEPLSRWAEAEPPDSPRRARIASELLKMIETIHAGRRVIGGWGPDDVLIDSTGRLTLQATDRVIPPSRSAMLRPWFPPNRYPAGYSAPETQDPASALDEKCDLYCWGALCHFLLAGQAPVVGADEAATVALVEQGLQHLMARDPRSVRALATGVRRSEQALATAWAKAVALCLATDPKRRPKSVRQVRQLAAGRGGFSLARLFGR